MGLFITCFLGITFLTVYLYIILYKLNQPFICGAKVIFAGIAIIFLRMCIPIDFPFTYTIYSTRFLSPMADIFYAPIGVSDYDLFDILIPCWLIIAILKLFRLCIRTIRLHNYLSAYTVTEDSHSSKLFAAVRKYGPKSIRIAIIPHNVSPAITGILHPTIIFPASFDCFSPEELDYICMHELNHYQNHDLWMKMLLEIISCVHWWNPLVYLMKREYSLTLELTNDYFIMQNHPNYSGIDYADLLLKAAKSTKYSLFRHSNELASFVRIRNLDLETRIHFALECSSKKIIKKSRLITHTIIILTVMVFSLFFVIEYSSWTPSHVIDDSYDLDPSHTYFIHTSDGYEVYVNGTYISTIIELPEDFKNHKIYEQGEPVK